MHLIFMLILSVFLIVGCDNGGGGSLEVIPTTTKAITAYSFAGWYIGDINESAKTIAVTVPNGIDVTNLVATFTITGTDMTVGDAPQISEETSNNFTDPVEYTVFAADLTNATYTVTVTVTDATLSSILVNPTTPSVATDRTKQFTATGNYSDGTSENITSFVTWSSGTTTVATMNPSGAANSGLATGVSAGISLIKAKLADIDSPGSTLTVKDSIDLDSNPAAPALGEAGRFVILASQTITTTTGSAISNGDLGITDQARSYYAGFTTGASPGAFDELTKGLSYGTDDSNPAPYPYPLHYSTPVVGALWTTTGAMLTQAKTDANIAYTFLAAATNSNPLVSTTILSSPQLGGQVLTRGVYKTAENVLITTGPLYLDAQGDPDSVFIFTIDGTLTTGAPGGNIILQNDAQAKNVFFRTAGLTEIGPGTIFYGDIFARSQVRVLAGANITGSLYAIDDQVTLISDIVTKAP